MVGSSTYQVLRDLLAPDIPASRNFEELLKVLKGHYKPARLVIAERFNFHRRPQQPGESAAQCMVELRRLAKTCHFGQFLNDALRDQLVCGLIATNTQKRPLSEANLTAERALEISQAMETVEKGGHRLQGGTPRLKTSRNRDGGYQRSKKTWPWFKKLRCCLALHSYSGL